MYLGVDFASFYDVSIGLGNCANSVVFLCLLDLGIVPTVWYFCVYWTWELCRQCGIFVSIGLGNCADSVVFLCLLDLGIVPTVWYFCVYWTWELCRQCGIFAFHFISKDLL
jgi:hypothetical protein